MDKNEEPDGFPEVKARNRNLGMSQNWGQVYLKYPIGMVSLEAN